MSRPSRVPFPGVFAVLAAVLVAATSSSTQQGTTIRVEAGGNLQAAIDHAGPGDTILLASGARFTGNFVLREHEGPAFVTIRTDSSRLPGADTRTSPRYADALAHLQSPSNLPALRTERRAHHWRIENVAFGPNRGGDGNIIALGDDGPTRREDIPHAFVLDRVYVYGDPIAGQKRGVALNSGATEIVNSYFADIKAAGIDTQAIAGWNGPGPYLIRNNYLEAAGENILFGGADPAIEGLIPQDITIVGNHITRPVSWRDPVLASPEDVRASAARGGTLPPGTYVYRVVAERPLGRRETAVSTPADSREVRLDEPASATIAWSAVEGAEAYRVYRTGGPDKPAYFRVTDTSFTDTGADGTRGAPRARGTVWQVKNLLELKTGRNVRIDGNLFEHHWPAAQAGYALVWKPENQAGRAPWTTVENIEFTNNVVREVSGGININGRDPGDPSGRARGIVVRNNLFVIDRTAWGGPGDFVQIGGGPADVTIERNTVVHDGRILALYGRSTPIEGLVFRGNVLRHNRYGVKGDSTAVGRASLEAFAPGASFEGNVIAGGRRSAYPGGNRFVDEKDIDARLRAAAGAQSARPPAGQEGEAGVDWSALARAFSASTSEPADQAPPRRSTD